MGSNDKVGTVSALEQFVLLSKTAKGAAAVELVKQALEAPNVYVFGELIDMPNITELESTHPDYFKLINMFAFGCYTDYKQDKLTLPALTPAMEKKLKHLTIVALASKNKCIQYSTLLEELDITNLRELEDLIIEVIYADIVQGKLDQQEQRLEVDSAIGRDIRPEAVDDIIKVLSQWCGGCEAVLGGIETQITKANSNMESQNLIKQKIENEVSNIKKTLKTTQQSEEEVMVTDSGIAGGSTEKITKKASKTKGIRGSGKFWNKS